MDTPVIMEARNVTKTFPGVVALKGINLSIRPGEVHALVGENGAGKSTLLNILTGVYAPDKGAQILFGGREVAFDGTEDSTKLGIARSLRKFVVQHLKVYENIFLATTKKRHLCGPGQMIRSSRELLDRLRSRTSPVPLPKDLSASKSSHRDRQALARTPRSSSWTSPRRP